MSTLDEYEHRRGPIYRRASKPDGARPQRRKTQLALRLVGGATRRDHDLPFDDDISHIGRAPKELAV